MLALDHAFFSGTSRLQFSTHSRGLSPRLAGRRSALETVEKIVTDTGQPGQPGRRFGA